MSPPQEAPGQSTVGAWGDYALAYLREQLREAAPTALDAPTLFPRSPLDGEGTTVVFPFSADRAGRGLENYYVVVGQTKSNYYAAQGLTPDEIFNVHLGTRFMLVLSVAQITNAISENYNAVDDARGIVDRVAPEATLESVTIAAAFNVGGQVHTVLSAKLNSEEVYIMGRDAPPGFYRRADLPPHIIFRLHIGTVLRAEPDPERHA